MQLQCGVGTLTWYEGMGATRLVPKREQTPIYGTLIAD